MKLVVGLGNPGRKYQGTRHNIGYDVLHELAKRHNASPSSLKHDSELRDIRIGETKVLLCAPLTYMNLSGQAVSAVVNFHKLDLSDVLIICDDMNLPLGKLRLRGSGSSGGQNGLKDIFRRLGTEEVPRLRIGIDRPPPPMSASAFVLQKFGEQDAETAGIAVKESADGVELWCREGLVPAMNQINSKRDT